MVISLEKVTFFIIHVFFGGIHLASFIFPRQAKTTTLLPSSIIMNQALCDCLTNAKCPFLGVLFASILLGWASTTDRPLTLASMGNMRKVSFPRTQQRITCSGIEPGSSYLFILSPMHYQLGNPRRY